MASLPVFHKACRSASRSQLTSLTTVRLIHFQSTIASSQTPTKRQSSLPPSGRQTHSLQRISTVNLIRNVVLGSTFTSPMLFKFGMTFLSTIANSESAVLDPDKNLLLRALIKPVVYDHFCAGTTKDEVRSTLAGLKDMGYDGVILIYSREIPAMPAESLKALEPLDHDEEIDSWRDGNLRTLGMVEKGDYVGVKFTGAGPRVAQALLEGRDPPQQVVDAMDKVCKKAASQGSRIWIDAEQQMFQPTIDRWTVDLMKRYNKDSQALVSLTLQAYLKSARKTLLTLLRGAGEGGWTLGVKLVRGAYIGSETRSLIHDTKPDTDRCYDSIVHDVLAKKFPGMETTSFPKVELFLAGHNSESIQKAYTLSTSLARESDRPEPVKFGQLLGMADDISCALLEKKENSRIDAIAPLVYKCMNWGSVRECMHYLVRRATENQSAAERMQSTVGVMKKELWRRIGM